MSMMMFPTNGGGMAFPPGMEMQIQLEQDFQKMAIAGGSGSVTNMGFQQGQEEFVGVIEDVPISVHEFFTKIKQAKSLVNRKAKRFTFRNKFSYFFELLFKDLDPIPDGNMKTWLNVFANDFTINMDYVKPFMMNEAQDLFQQLDLNPEDKRNQNIFQFWIYLNKMYMSLFYNNYRRRDTIFGFTTGFPIQQTKVVIVGQDPSRGINSSGFAFHLSPCKSTQELMKTLSNELSLFYALSGGAAPKLFLDQYERANNSGDLSGWINQGVLLINANLTHTNGKTQWTGLLRFLIKYLSYTLENLVFIFVGQVAQLKVRYVNQKKHKIIRVVHPASYSYVNRSARPQKKQDWDRVLPFINTNFCKLQKSPSAALIDWHHVNGIMPVNDSRMDKMREFLLNVLKDPRNEALKDVNAKYFLAKFSASMNGPGPIIEDTEVYVRRHVRGHLVIESLRIPININQRPENPN